MLVLNAYFSINGLYLHITCSFILYRYAIFMSDLLIKKKHVGIPNHEKKLKKLLIKYFPRVLNTLAVNFKRKI